MAKPADTSAHDTNTMLLVQILQDVAKLNLRLDMLAEKEKEEECEPPELDTSEKAAASAVPSIQSYMLENLT